MIRSTMALRNTLRQPRRTMLLGGAIAFGVIIICLASGFTSGMEVAVQDNVTLFSAGHVLVSGIAASESGRAQNRISDVSLAQKAKQILPEAVSISETAQSQATVVFGSREQQLRVRGVDWTADKLFSGSLILTQGDWTAAKADRAIILGAQSARRFGLGLGDSLFVKLSTVSGQQNVTEYKLGAVYDDSAAGGMTTAIVPLANLLADLNMKQGQYQSLAVFLTDASQADKAAAKLTAGLKKAGYSMIGTAVAAAGNRQAASGQGAGGQASGNQSAGNQPTGGQASSNPLAGGQSSTATTIARGAASGSAQGANSRANLRGTRRQALSGNNQAGNRQAGASSATTNQSALTTPNAAAPTTSVLGSAGGPPAATAGNATGAGGNSGGGVGNNGAGGNIGGVGNSGGGGNAAAFGRGIMNQLFSNAPVGTTFYRVATVTELSGQMGAVLGSVRWIGITIFVIMLVLVAAGITNTYRMVLMERTKEIGMLRCIGFKRSDIFRIFVYEAGLIAIAGSLAGILASLPIGLLVHLIPFNPSGSLGSALARGRLTFAPHFVSLTFVSLAVIVASILAVVGPARKASRLLPVEALRTTA
jgi:ABC-type lipoprotein release transport system permease subunit